MDYKTHNDTCNKVLDAIYAIETDDYKLARILAEIHSVIKDYRNFPNNYRIDTMVTCIKMLVIFATPAVVKKYLKQLRHTKGEN